MSIEKLDYFRKDKFEYHVNVPNKSFCLKILENCEAL